ncbi:hypothetical protein HPB48_014453 [Haemaphysalis longicornis]|uniref:Uncharacterized protein n=1 Tax=Haemaphysalis longicornis TaxID=44386 RepID=A0A9J6H3N7_HAELO|nr:hypothetical protein HPB48_014453 [Haemaphysalis longicornis]
MRVAPLLYVGKEELLQKYTTFALSDKQQKLLTVLEQFDLHFKRYQNTTHASHVFHTMKQTTDQTFEMLAQVVTKQADQCAFGKARNRMVNDWLVNSPGLTPRTCNSRGRQCSQCITANRQAHEALKSCRTKPKQRHPHAASNISCGSTKHFDNSATTAADPIIMWHCVNNFASGSRALLVSRESTRKMDPCPRTC